MVPAKVPARAQCALGGEYMLERLRITLPEVRIEAVFHVSRSLTHVRIALA